MPLYIITNLYGSVSPLQVEFVKTTDNGNSHYRLFFDGGIAPIISVPKMNVYEVQDESEVIDVISSGNYVYTNIYETEVPRS